MAILNYSTTIVAEKTIMEIEKILVIHHAKSIMKDYDNTTVVGLSFLIFNGTSNIPVRLPAKIEDFLAYIVDSRDNRTMFEKLAEKQFLIE